MAQVETEIDSIRVAAACSDRTLILKQKYADSYLRIWIIPSQADILADQLHGRLDSKKELDALLTSHNATDSDIGCATIYLEDTSFFAKVLLSRHRRPYEGKCPIGLALALAARASAPILVDEALFDRAGVHLS